MSLRHLPGPLKWALAALAGLGITAICLAVEAASSTAAYAVTPDTCSVSSATATITLGGGPTTIGQTSSGDLVLDGNPGCGSTTFPLAGATLDLTGTATSVTLDQYTNGAFPSNLVITGSISAISAGAPLPLIVEAGTGQSLTFGSSGFTLDPTQTTADSLGGVSQYQVTATAGPLTVSGAGSSLTGGSVGSPVLLQAAPSSADYSLGGNVILQAQGGSPQGSPPAYTVVASGAPNQVSNQVDAPPSANQSFDISGGGVDFVAGAATDTVTLTGNNYVVSGGAGSVVDATVQPSSGQTTISGDSFEAGSGTESFNVTVPSKDTLSTSSFVGGSDSVGSDSFAVTGAGSATSDTLKGGVGSDSFSLTTSSNDSNTYLGSSGTDTVTMDGNENTFVVGSGTESFFDTNNTTTTSANTVNFSAVGASSSAPLVINDSGTSQTAGSGTSSVLLGNGQATQVGSKVTYTFRDSSSTTSSDAFSVFVGATGGNTQFLAGGQGGLTFNGQGSGNSASFFGSVGVVANLSSGLQTVSGSLGPTGPQIAGFEIGAGDVLVSSPGSSTSCSGSPVAPYCDALTGVLNLTGPPGGYSRFYAGDQSGPYDFSDAGNHNTFIGGAGPANFSSSGDFNTFVAGTGSETFTETTSDAEPSNQIDFSALPVGSALGCLQAPCTLTINVSGNATAVPNYVAALFNGLGAQVSTYSFGQAGGGGDFTSFVGASGGQTTFEGGLISGAAPSGSPNYQGQGNANTLTFADSTLSSLSLNVTTTPFAQALLNGTSTETFEGITTLVGARTGGTDFSAGSTGGYTFSGLGSGNQVSFAAQGPSTNLTVQVSSNGSLLNSGTVSFYLAGSQTPLCAAVPVSGGQASCYATNLSTGTNQVVAIYQPQAGSSTLGSSTVLTLPLTLTSQAGGPTPTSTTVRLPPSALQGQFVTLSSTTTTASGVGVRGGTVVFSLAGGIGLCSSASVSPVGVASCTATLPAGSDDVLAVYTPPSGSGLAGSAASVTLSVSNPEPTTTASVSYSSPFSGVDCNGTFLDCLSATVTGIPSGDSGSVSFYYDSLGPLCTSPSLTSAGQSLTFQCSPLLNSQLVFTGEPVLAVFNPSLGSGLGVSASPVYTVNSAFFGRPPVASMLSVIAPASLYVGASYTIMATISVPSSSGDTLPGGTLSLALADGAAFSPICSVAVPSGNQSATLECSAQFPAGPGAVVALYQPPSSSNVAGAVATASVDATQGTPSQIAEYGTGTALSPGVTVNTSQSNVELLEATATGSTSLSGGTISFSSNGQALCVYQPVVAVAGAGNQATATCVTGSSVVSPSATYNPAPGSSASPKVSVVAIQVGPGQALVAAPPSPTSSPSCSAVPLPTYCDQLSDVGVYVGSSGGSNVFVAGPSSETFADPGTTGGDTLDFAPLNAGAGATLTVNVSGVGTSDYSATLGSDTYSFGQGGPGFNDLIGSGGGFTTFEAGSAGGYLFEGLGSNDQISFAADPNPVTFNLSSGNYLTQSSVLVPGQVLVSPGSCPSACDRISGFSTLVGSSAGSNRFVAGPTSEVFQGGSSNFVDFSNLATPVVVNDSSPGSSPQATTYGTATSAAGSVYDFSAFEAVPTTFIGSPAGTTFYAGGVADTFVGQGNPANSTLSYAFAVASSLSLNTVTPGSCNSGNQAVLGTTTECFSGIDVLDGLGSAGSSTPSTTFVAGGTGGYAFVGQAGTNVADFSAAPGGVLVNLSAFSTLERGVTLGPGQVLVSGTSCAQSSSCDELADVSSVIGSKAGGNVFVAGSTSETFADTGGTGADAIDFSHLNTGSSAPLVVNVSGVGTSDYSATFGTVTYSFGVGGPGFLTLVGATPGFTTFVAGANPGYALVGQGSSNTADFSASACPVVANLATGMVTVSRGSSCATPGTDSVSDITTVVGSAAGSNTFVAAGGASETFEGGSSNTVDLSQLPSPAVVNVAGPGVSPDGTAYGTATTSAGSVYNFSAFESDPTTFVGSGAGTTFFAGTTADTFLGRGTAATNTLSFADALTGAGISPTSLILCVAASSPAGCASPGTALVGTVTESFSGIANFAGLGGTSSSSTFVAGGTGGLSFSGVAGTDVADFTPASAGVVVNLSSSSYTTSANVTVGAGQVLVQSLSSGQSCQSSPLACDQLSGVATVAGSANGGNVFVAGPQSQTFLDRGGSGGDTLDFSNLTTTSASNPLTINASGSAQGALAPYSASFESFSYAFATGGAGFTTFVGARSGDTRFVASGSSAGLTLRALGAADTADFSQASSGVVVNLVAGTVGVAGGTDTLAGTFSSVVGSAVGANTFYGALTGTQFSSTSSDNTVSYLKLTSLPAGAGVLVNLLASRVSLLCPTGVSGCPTTTPDTFAFPSGAPLTVQGSPGPDRFVIGTAAVTLQGGGGADTLDLSGVAAPSSGSQGVDLNLVTGTISGPTIGTSTFSPGCSSPSQLCVQTVFGSPYNDTFTLSPSLVVSVAGGGGLDTLDLSQFAGPLVVRMPIAGQQVSCANLGQTSCGTVTEGGTTVAYFSGIGSVQGSGGGGDHFYAGTGTETLNEIGTKPGTLDFSALPSQGTTGVELNVGEVSGVATGTATTATVLTNVSFSGFGSFVGSANGDDVFTQTSAGSFNFVGGAGLETLNLSGAGSGLTVSFAGNGANCPGLSTNDGTVNGTGVADTFSCMATVVTTGSELFQVSPGQNATLSGGGSGTLQLVGATSGATISLGTTGSVVGGGYDFSFSGMATVIGTGLGDSFVAGPGNYQLEEPGGANSISFWSAPAAIMANDTSSAYKTPGGTTVPAFSVVGGWGGNITMSGINYIIGTSRYDDVLVAPAGPGSLIGGSGSVRFVLSGGDTLVQPGSGSNALDLSLLAGPTYLDLGQASPQFLGPQAGMLTLEPGNISAVYASPAGSDIWGGNGTLTVVGSSGTNWLAAGVGNQTLVGGSGPSTLLAGIGTDTLEAGSGPTTFVPGQGSDTLVASSGGNTLSYAGNPNPVQINLTSSLYTVPAGKPFAGAVLQANAATGGWGATVNLAGAGISSVVGSPQSDVIVVGSNLQVQGGGGNDLFVIEGGNNNVSAGPGTASTFLIDGPGNNVLSGGGDATLDFSQATSAVTVNLQVGQASGGFGGSDSLSGFANVIGPSLPNCGGPNCPTDVLVGGPPGGTITALGGNNLLEAGPGGGDTLVATGGGVDTFCAESICAVPGTVAGGGDVMIGGSGQNTFYAQNGVPDTIVGGSGFNEAAVDPNEDKYSNIQVFLNGT